jgi:lathosterol oxidase
MGPMAIWLWLGAFVIVGALAIVFRGFFMAKKIQPKGFRWKIFRNEIFFGILNLAASAFLLGGTTAWLRSHGLISFNSEPAAWYVIAVEYALYFFLFDTWFYWLHRAMHIQPFYKYIHQIHHYSISPNPMTTLSVNPLESFINGGFVPLFTALLTVHEQTFLLIAPTNIIMGLYVHSGFEFLPRWWTKTWATKWFITATFHDQHHRYSGFNYGGYTTIWDYICGTRRKKYEQDFVAITTRPINAREPIGGAAPAPAEG